MLSLFLTSTIALTVLGLKNTLSKLTLTVRHRPPADDANPPEPLPPLVAKWLQSGLDDNSGVYVSFGSMPHIEATRPKLA